jgi:hypothetical protein
MAMTTTCCEVRARANSVQSTNKFLTGRPEIKELGLAGRLNIPRMFSDIVRLSRLTRNELQGTPIYGPLLAPTLLRSRRASSEGCDESIPPLVLRISFAISMISYSYCLTTSLVSDLYMQKEMLQSH